MPGNLVLASVSFSFYPSSPPPYLDVLNLVDKLVANRDDLKKSEKNKELKVPSVCVPFHIQNFVEPTNVFKSQGFAEALLYDAV